jgi:hypothetical protein
MLTCRSTYWKYWSAGSSGINHFNLLIKTFKILVSGPGSRGQPPGPICLQCLSKYSKHWPPSLVLAGSPLGSILWPTYLKYLSAGSLQDHYFQYVDQHVENFAIGAWIRRGGLGASGTNIFSMLIKILRILVSEPGPSDSKALAPQNWGAGCSLTPQHRGGRSPRKDSYLVLIIPGTRYEIPCSWGCSSVPGASSWA